MGGVRLEKYGDVVFLVSTVSCTCAYSSDLVEDLDTLDYLTVLYKLLI